MAGISVIQSLARKPPSRILEVASTRPATPEYGKEERGKIKEERGNRITSRASPDL